MIKFVVAVKQRECFTANFKYLVFRVMRREIKWGGILRAALGPAAFFVSVSVCFQASGQEKGRRDTLSAFQRQSIIDYCEEYGEILSSSELSLVDGFTADEALWLWNDAKSALPSPDGGTSHLVTARFKKKFLSDGFSATVRYDLAGRKLSAGLTLDNDPMEKPVDFISGYVKYGRVLAGDFSARFGQGLVMWNGLAMNVMGEPSSLARRAGGLKGYRSTDESDFLRGAAVSFDVGRRCEVSVFASYNALDAAADDSSYTSIVTGGLHSTDSEIAKRHSMHEVLAGTNVSFSGSNWKVGATAAGYSYDRKNGRKVKDYNRLQQYDGLWGNFSADWTVTLGHWRLFGEAALDAHLAPAVLSGVIWSPSYGFEVSAVAKVFSPSYIAAHSAGSAYNQVGGAVAARYRKGRWTFNMNVDAGWYPWYRYQKPAGGGQLKLRLAAQYAFSAGPQILCQLSFSSILKGKLHVSVPIGRFSVNSRFEANEGGLATFLEGTFTARRLQISARGTFYNVSDWEHRVCFYEKGTPQSFSMESYYGKGYGGYLTLKYTPVRNLDLWLKLQQNYCAFFMRIFIPG